MRVAAAQLPPGTTPPTAEVLAARIDSIVRADIQPLGFPSVSIAITRGGRTLLERAWGVADVATGRKADPATTYRIASVAKQFTAALVLKQVDRGTLSLADSIGRHLKALPPAWNAITVEQLLNHTSGLAADYLPRSRAGETLPSDSLVAMAARTPLVSTPGTAYAYSNTGYMLLAVMLERMHGKPFGAVLRDEIVRPLGLTSLGWCEDMEAARAATGYDRTSFGDIIPSAEQRPSLRPGAEGICSTAGDLARWNQALHGGRVISAASYAAMTTPRGVARNYGFGIRTAKARWGAPSIMHDGQVAGFVAHNAWFPAESLSVTLLFNAIPSPPGTMTDFVGLIALGGTPRPLPRRPVAQLPATAMQGPGRPKFVGAYELAAGRAFIVTFENGNLYVTTPGGDPQQLFLQSGTAYTLGRPPAATTVTFRVDANGVVTGFTARSEEGERELRKVK